MLGAVLLALALTLTLSACGGGSSAKTTTKSAASTTAGGSGATARVRTRGLAKLRECLQQNGIKLPKRRGLGGGYLNGTSRVLPPGVSRSQYEAVLKKCGGAPLLRGGTRGFGRLNTPAFKAGLKQFAACMRAAGVNVPEPNTSGKGPIFSTAGLNPRSSTFRKASAKCSKLLANALRRPPAGSAPPG
ncbi:MAG TPA: hypothetical protein VHT27_09995 [Solirubrobacteraceae bacterium]|nr:hypothetical protein [Solirubrobacteraceae bacterium]